VLDAVVPLLEDLAATYGLSSKLRSVRSVDIPVLELDDHDRLVAALAEESIRAIEDDGAHAIVFGCTGMLGCADGLRATLAERGYPGIPVIDPVIAAFKIAEALVDLGLTPSQRTYPTPRQKELVGYDAGALRAAV
jgi:allantoin racemase